MDKSQAIDGCWGLQLPPKRLQLVKSDGSLLSFADDDKDIQELLSWHRSNLDLGRLDLQQCHGPYGPSERSKPWRLVLLHPAESSRSMRNISVQGWTWMLCVCPRRRLEMAVQHDGVCGDVWVAAPLREEQKKEEHVAKNIKNRTQMAMDGNGSHDEDERGRVTHVRDLMVAFPKMHSSSRILGSRWSNSRGGNLWAIPGQRALTKPRHSAAMLNAYAMPTQLKPWHVRSHVEKPWIQPWEGLSELDVARRGTETGRIDLSWMLWWPWRQARFGAEVQGGDPNAVKNLWRCHRSSAWGKAEQARWCFRAIFPSAVVHSSTQESCIHALLWRPRDLRQLLCGSMLRRSKYEVLRDLLAKRGETSFWRRIRCHAAGRYNVMAPDTKCYLVYVSKKNPNRPVQKSAAQKIKRRKKRQKKSWTFLNRIFEDCWGDLSFNRCGATHAVCVAWSLSVTLVSLVA